MDRKLPSVFGVTVDLRVELLKCHIGLRVRPMPLTWRWVPYGWWPTTCLWFGPVEFTVFCSKMTRWFDVSAALDFKNNGQEISFRLNPFWRWRWSHEMHTRFTPYVSSWCGPVWIYIQGLKNGDT